MPQRKQILTSNSFDRAAYFLGRTWVVTRNQLIDQMALECVAL